jgi:large exoprotein involved in heme utilization and adhesion
VRSAGEVGVGAGSLTATGVTAYGDISLANANLNTWGGGIDPTVPGPTSGPIYIRGGRLTMNQSTLSTSLTGPGTGANIDIALSGDLSMTGGALQTTSTGTGNAGTITLQAANVTTSNAALIDTSAISGSAGGRAGAITIAASGDVSIAGGTQVTSVTYALSGQGGDTNITARNLTVAGALSQINVSTFGDGAGGNIVINVDSLRVADGAKIIAASQPHPTAGPAGGNAGSIDITAAHSVTLENGGRISTTSQIAGGGQITIRATDVVSLNHGTISTSVADGTGNGGDILIDPMFVTLTASQILAQTFNGVGGHLVIITPNFVCPDCASGGSAVNSLAFGTVGVPGVVQVSSPNVDAGSGLAVLPSGYFDPSALLRESCAVRGARLASSFVGAGRGALPAGPDAARYGPYALGPVSAAVLATARVPQAGQSALQGCSG